MRTFFGILILIVIVGATITSALSIGVLIQSHLLDPKPVANQVDLINYEFLEYHISTTAPGPELIVYSGESFPAPKCDGQYLQPPAKVEGNSNWETRFTFGGNTICEFNGNVRFVTYAPGHVIYVDAQADNSADRFIIFSLLGFLVAIVGLLLLIATEDNEDEAEEDEAEKAEAEKENA